MTNTFWKASELEALRRMFGECSSMDELVRRFAAEVRRDATPAAIRAKLKQLGFTRPDSAMQLRAPRVPREAGKGVYEPGFEHRFARLESVVERIAASLKTDPIPPPPETGELEVDVEVPGEDDGPASREGAPGQDPDGELLDRLVSFTRKPRTLEEVCDELELPPSRVRELVARARESAHRVDIAGQHVGHRPSSSESDETFDIRIAAAGEERIFAAVGDIHFGSKHHKRAEFRDFCQKAYDAGCRQALHPGDMLDGVYKHSRWEQDRHGFEEQCDQAVEELPRFPGWTWYFIQGNHDETLGQDSGLDVGRAIEQKFLAAGRSDVKYLGARGAYVRLVAPGDRRGLYVHLWHPSDKGNSYAISYPLQKKVEGFVPGAKPDVLLAGHWHQATYVPIRAVHCLAVGCWQGGQSSFGKSLRSSPKIGSWIVRYRLTDAGAVRSFLPEWVEYHERETVRDVSLG